jgi:hypothetical protein
VLIKRNSWLKLLTNLPSYFRDFRRNPQKFFVFILGRFIIVRKLYTLFLSPQRSCLPQTSTIFTEIDTDRAVKSLQKNGYYLGLKLSPSVLQKILNFAYSAEMKIEGAPDIRFTYAEKNKAETKYRQDIIMPNYVDPSSRCDAIKQLETDAKLLKIAAKYLGSNPIHIRTILGWCFPANSEAYKKLGKWGIPITNFHCDLDDYRTIKFFFYFTDVDEKSGAHVCIRGSHNRRSFRHYFYRSHSDRSIIDYYGAENVVNICGEAGFGFAEDPFCFHRGTPPIAKPRLMLQILYALNDRGI